MQRPGHWEDNCKMIYLTNWRPSFLCVCPVIDHEFRHNIVKVAVDPRGDSRVPDYFDNVMTKFLVNKRTEALQTDINLFFYDNKLTNSNFPLSFADASHKFQIHVSVRILTIKVSQWLRVNFSSNHKNYNFLDCDWYKKLLFSTNSLAKLLSDCLLLDTLLPDSSISQSHSKL